MTCRTISLESTLDCFASPKGSKNGTIDKPIEKNGKIDKLIEKNGKIDKTIEKMKHWKFFVNPFILREIAYS